MKHTPELWYAKNTSGDQALIIDEQTGRNVAVVYDKKDGGVIAATLDLYEACKRALVYVQSDPAVYPLICSLQEAIAKAEGRE